LFNRKGCILGRLLLKFLPWWLFGLVAIVMLPVTIEAGRAFWVGQSTVAAAQASSPPAAVGVADFDATRDVAVMDEVRLTGIWLSDLGVGTIAKDKVDDAYVVVKDATETTYAVLYFPSYEAAAVEKGLRALIDAQGRVTVAGFRDTSTTAAAAVTTDLTARGLAAGPPLVVLEPYFGDRAAALRDQLQIKTITFAIIAGVNLIVLAIAVVKFRAWRARVAAQRPAMPSATAMPRVTATAARTAAQARTPVPAWPPSATPSPRDPFASGPIQSPKGWFR
jgi:hypothetical protein